MTKTIFNSHISSSLFRCIVACALLAALQVIAQDAQSEFQFPSIPAALEKKLAARASNVDEVTLNKSMLNFGSQFLNGNQKDDRQAKRLIQNLNGIYVRDFDFKAPGAYSQEDVEAIRHQFLGPQWNSMVHERSLKNGTSTDVYVKMVNGQVHGMFVLDAEPKELDLVYISGTIDPRQLGELGGNFGIPNIKTDDSANHPKGSSR